MVTPVSGDEFGEPFVDIDEWRDAPVRHRYVHGGFAGTATRFSFYLPPADAYGGRFFQHITPVPDSENLAQAAVGEEDKIGFSIASGAYFVETNGGGGPSGGPGLAIDPTIAAYRANAASATFSRTIAAEMYGEHRPFGYAYGGSGGGFRTIGAAENTSGVWDGFVPYVIGSPMAIPNMFTVRMHAMRVLRKHFDGIVDAMEPGGSGDPYEGLDEEQREALREVTRMGFPLRSWFGHRTMGMHAFPVLYGAVRMVDPTYFEEFWTQPGYLGQAMPPSLQGDIVQLSCRIVTMITEPQAIELGLIVGRQPGQSRGGVDTAWQGEGGPPAIIVAVQISRQPGVDILGAELVVNSGAASGQRIGLLSVVGDVAIFGPAAQDVLTQLQPGDDVEIDNRGYLAAQTYHRHQVPGPDYPTWDQFRNDDGTPIYPQRPMLLGPLFAAGAAGTVQTGRFQGKMIVVETLLDREALPWQADWYRNKVVDHFGEATEEHFRVWFVDNALHGDSEEQEDRAHTVSYLGALHQALRDVSAWVEGTTVAAANTSYRIEDGQVIVPASANERRGVQPVVIVTVDGGARAEVRVGQQVTLRAVAEVPAGLGQIVSVDWNFGRHGDADVAEFFEPGEHLAVERQLVYTEPGTYFVTVRIAAQRDGDQQTPYARIKNLARARVVVS